MVADLDEHVRLGIERWVNDAMHTREFSEDAYQRGLLRTLKTLRERGRTVILGRGSAYVLPVAHTLRVLVVASEAFRRERRREALQLDADTAAARVAEEERDRKSFIDFHFHVDPDDPALYDLVVNTETLGMEEAARLVVAAFCDRFPRFAPRASPRGVRPGASVASAAALSYRSPVAP